MTPIAGSSLKDVLIVGAGPAGSIAAYWLASQGLSVALIEKEKLPRYKTCGGGLVHRCRQNLPFSIDECVENECFVAQMRLLGSGMTFQVERPEPIVSMTMRSNFDSLLVEEAREAGAEILDESPCTSVELLTEGIRIRAGEQLLEGRFLLAADGVHSSIARKLHWPDQPYSIPALEWELAVPGKVLQRYQGRACFDFGAAPLGYGWVFPKKEHLSVGILSTQRGSRSLRACLLRYLADLGIPIDDPIHVSGHQIPIRPRKTFARGRVLLLGDAAGLAEPVTAEGISFAIQSGTIAAQALVEEQLRAPESAQTYQQRLVRNVGNELRWGRVVAALTYRYPRARDLLFQRQGQRLCEVMTDIFMGSSSYHSLAHQPSNYLKFLRRIPAPGSERDKSAIREN